MRNGAEVLSPGAGALVRQEFGSSAMEVRAETAATAVAAQAQAAVQARYVMALRAPRDWDVVRQRILKECDRPGFADVARYQKPVGGGTVDGLSIRFAEAALRCMTNCLPETTVVYEDRSKRIMRVALTDLEANLTYSKDVVIEKVVERSKVREGQEVVGERTNTHGKKTFLVVANEDELLNKQAALESKALRGHVLRILPGDIADEAEARILSTLKNRATKDPAAERRAIIDAFGALGVDAAQLKLFVGCPLEQLNPADLVELRAVYGAVKSGEASWRDLLENKQGSRTKPEAPATQPAASAPAPKAEPAPTAAASQAAPSEPAPSAPSATAANGAPDPADVLLGEIETADSIQALDALMPRAKALPQGAGRAAVGAALSQRRNALKGAR